MTTPIYFLAHPFGGYSGNEERAMRWCSVLSWEFDALFVAPWVPMCRYWKNYGDHLLRGMHLNFTAIRAAHGIILVGGSITANMASERSFAASICGKAIIDASRFRAPEELLADPDGVELLTCYVERRAT